MIKLFLIAYLLPLGTTNELSPAIEKWPVITTIEQNSLINYIQRYQADHQLIQRKYALKRTTFYFNRATNFYQDWLTELKGIDFSKLNQAEKVDYYLLQRNIKADLDNLNNDFADFKNFQGKITYLNLVEAFENIRRIGEKPPAQLWKTNFEKLLQEIDNTNEYYTLNSLSLKPHELAWVNTTASQYFNVFKEAYKFYDGYDPQFTASTGELFKKINLQFDKHIKNLGQLGASSKVSDDGSGIIGNPIGEAAFIQLLNKEMIAYSPAELEKIAWRELAWSEAEMIKASTEMGFGKDWKKALEKVKLAYPPLGEQPELVYFLANEAINFIESNQLIKVPTLAKEGWRMRMLSPQEQLFAPFFLGGESVLIAYPHESMSEEAKAMTLRGNNRHFSRAVVHHELIPGHNLQYFMQNRYNTYRRAFDTPFWTEGWSLYWEMLLWEKNFAQNPADKIGMLFWRMHRSARIIFSMNYHLQKWTPNQCIDFLVDKVGFERANAEAEVRRSFTGGYGPLYQIGYMLGGLQFKSLQTEVVNSGKMNFIDFHDWILKQNAMPVEMLRILLLNLPMTENYTTQWKFAGEFN
ncbi:MAG: DUF885 family protein [Pedobacter sp.]|nr:MAG: DUF885 family protein [Pedobacter sp.]